MKRILIAIIFFCFQSCIVKEKENAEVKTSKDSSDIPIVSNTKTVSETINLEKYLNVVATDSISINSISEKVFELEQSDLFFLAFSRDKIAADLNEEESLINVFNPFSGKVYKQIDLMNYTKDFFKYSRSYVPSETRLGRNNIGQIKIMITDGRVPQNSSFSISYLDLSNLKTQTIGLNSNKKRLSIEDYNKVFGFEELFFLNDSLYYLYDLEEIAFTKGDTNLYKINLVNDEMILGNENVIKHGNDYCVLRFPYKDKLFFCNSNSNYNDLFSYNIITRKSKKYVIPLLQCQFYFAEDGFFIASLPEGKETSDTYRYGFVPY
ncbi:MAG: hypothetical protein J7604_16885 [Sporocytophaga sp.]|uniref:hypothetical protein n=1 Tax=Sporocytophaga sp. TaxID=2231183 RepID=UPI001B18A5C0|nr:hypothetical protein [Sporocytophaga sp.]MBO9701886.1 hypothetical protein [Sporocytophaga sp.]